MALDFFPGAPPATVDWSKTPARLPTVPGPARGDRGERRQHHQEDRQAAARGDRRRRAAGAGRARSDARRARAARSRADGAQGARSTAPTADRSPNSVLGAELGNTLQEVSRAARGRCACSRTTSSAIPSRSSAARAGRRSDASFGMCARSCCAVIATPAAAGRRRRRFYTLESTATRRRRPAARYAVIVGPVTVPASVDRPEFVCRSRRTASTVDEFNRWAAPLGRGIARAVAGDLTALLGTPRRGDGAARELRTRLSRDDRRAALRLDPRQEAALDAVWVVRRTRAVRRGRAARSRASRCRARASTRSPRRTAGRSRR